MERQFGIAAGLLSFQIREAFLLFVLSFCCLVSKTNIDELGQMLVFFFVLCIFPLVLSKEIYVCESQDEKYLGKYVEGQRIDGVPSYTNANELSFFRNKGFWYMGNLGPWPPETHFRCVDMEKCAYEGDFPSLGEDAAWTVNKKVSGDIDTPKFSESPCSRSDEEL